MLRAVTNFNLVAKQSEGTVIVAQVNRVWRGISLRQNMAKTSPEKESKKQACTKTWSAASAVEQLTQREYI